MCVEVLGSKSGTIDNKGVICYSRGTEDSFIADRQRRVTGMYNSLKEETIGLSNYGMKRLIEYARFLKHEDNAISDCRMNNISILEEIKKSQSVGDEDYVSEIVIDNVLKLVFNLNHQPELFKTYENSINLQFELEDNSYMELEVFEDRITCMVVKQRDYDNAIFPEVSMNDMDGINRLVEEFYGVI